MPRPMQSQAGLLLRRFNRHEAHSGPLHGLANRFGISRVVLLAFDIRLHVDRRHKFHVMPERRELPRPIMGGGASFDANQARRHLHKKWQNTIALQLLPDNHFACRINAVTWKTDFAMSRPMVVTVFMWLPPNCGHLIGNRFVGASAPVEGAVHSIISKHPPAEPLISQRSETVQPGVRTRWRPLFYNSFIRNGQRHPLRRRARRADNQHRSKPGTATAEFRKDK